MIITEAVVFFTAVAQVYGATIKKSSGLVAQFSPSFPSLPEPTNVVTTYQAGPYATPKKLSRATLKGFPEPWEAPDTSSAEVQAVYKKLDFTKIPKAPVRKQNPDGTWVSTSDGESDPFCWWSSTNCVKPKASYLPPDIYTCPKKGDWGLTYDDGPYNLGKDDKVANKYAEPYLLNYLAENNLHATLFYIGSNVATFPDAARLGLKNGHQLCVHTWSHRVLTTLTDVEIVAELYWTLKAIKAATGVTSKCFRPPQGDVDDRVRAIAYQMGMRTVLWDEDTQDWNLLYNKEGSLSRKEANGYFETWIKNYKTGKDKSGHIVLEHELNPETVELSISWLPKLKQTFNVVPALSCNGITHPYWEESFEYPLFDSSDNGNSTAKNKTSATSSAAPSPTSSSAISSSTSTKQSKSITTASRTKSVASSTSSIEKIA
ncbi:hypothetical protein [Parasitella parasitica]|uniref:NodB homology domain-containing protein n=1 Tax=Parasitella parasitica TaxID=35722 RepID=A0A0B7NLZ1_9FUNG|nr:hypothetical protein [Parasitella parasitica]